jgi:hypothetical protein
MGTTRTRRRLLPGRDGVERLLAAVRHRAMPGDTPSRSPLPPSAGPVRSPWTTFARAAAGAALVAGALAGATVTAGTAGAATSGPCDIYAAGGTPCVAAPSTTRAQYPPDNGPL